MPSTVRFPVPTRADQCDFLLRVYFGAGADDLTACVHRAYFDLSRTLHGFSRLPLPRRVELQYTSARARPLDAHRLVYV